MIKITVTKDELQKKLAAIQNIVDKKGAMPILNHFLLTVSNLGVTITATDLETALVEPLNATVISEGGICVPARHFLDIVKEMDGEITIEEKENDRIVVKNGNSKFKVACLKALEFPTLPNVNSFCDFEIETKKLVAILDKTLYSAGDDNVRYVINGLLFHITPKGEMSIIGTNGHRLAIVENAIATTQTDESKTIVPRKSLIEIRKLIGDEIVKIKIGGNHVEFNFGECSLIARTYDGAFPNYQQVIPTNPNRLSVDKQALIKGIRRVATVLGSNIGLKMDITANNIILSASNADIGEAKEEVPAEFSGEDISMSFNYRYVMEAITPLVSANTIIKINEPLSPVLITGDRPDDLNYKAIVMPMRL